MSEPNPAETALRAGLRALPVPNPGPDFDACVLAAVRQRRSGWRALFTGRSAFLRPVLGGAACSALVMGVLLRGATNGGAPTAPVPTGRATGGAPVFVAALASPAALDAFLARGDLSVAALTGGRPALLRAPILPAARLRPVPPSAPTHRARRRGAALPPPGLPLPKNGVTT